MATSSLARRVADVCGDRIDSLDEQRGQLTVETRPRSAPAVLRALRDDPGLCFEQLIDLCGVDYCAFGHESDAQDCAFPEAPRLAVVYHLLSITHNHRARVRAMLDENDPVIDSAVELWPAADWYEREAFDLYGIVFNGHPDLRRLLTDYGFIGHPLRKDFPVSGRVETRYDEKRGRVVYQPVSIEPRVLAPRVIREDGYDG